MTTFEVQYTVTVNFDLSADQVAQAGRLLNLFKLPLQITGENNQAYAQSGELIAVSQYQDTKGLAVSVDQIVSDECYCENKLLQVKVILIDKSGELRLIHSKCTKCSCSHNLFHNGFSFL